jgi:hypothetical protein
MSWQPLKFSNPPGRSLAPVSVAFELEKKNLVARYRIEAESIYAKPQLARSEYPYEFDVVELFVRNSAAGRSEYYEFEVSPHNQSLQVTVIDPRQEFHFGVKNGFTHSARIVSGGWEAEMTIPLLTLGWDGGPKPDLLGNACAALGQGEKRVYWSLFELPAGKPDFHVPAAFRSLL